MLRGNVAKMFYDAEAGKVRGDVHISDIHSTDARYRTGRPNELPMTFIDGPAGVHEGLMLALYVTLMGTGLPSDAAEKIWSSIAMERVETK